MRAAQPGAAVVVATGRGDAGAGLPAGEAIDRAARLLEEASAHQEDPPLDDVTAGLLDARFEVADAAGGGRALRRERDTIEPAHRAGPRRAWGATASGSPSDRSAGCSDEPAARGR